VNELEPDYLVSTVVIAADAYADLLAERDALAAQCAALAEEAGVNPNDIPAAAAVYLAAERAMRAHGDSVMWTPALIAWRKAAGK
jgi:uncharacterized protein involved in exopolysaccharide biosynthesis